jgi:DNA invertase Pin-like site-specific DNA recombinase
MRIGYARVSTTDQEHGAANPHTLAQKSIVLARLFRLNHRLSQGDAGLLLSVA